MTSIKSRLLPIQRQRQSNSVYECWYQLRRFLTVAFLIVAVLRYDSAISGTTSYTLNTLPQRASTTVFTQYNRRQDNIPVTAQPRVPPTRRPSTRRRHVHSRQSNLNAVSVSQLSTISTTVNGYNNNLSSNIDDTTTQQQQPKVGVLLLNLGGPETGDDVEGFLYNLFADPDIIRLPPLLSPLQGLIAYFIARRRAPKSRAAYDSIGGGSPILKYSRNQASLIAQSIQDRYNVNVKTYIGMRYWHPFTEEALQLIRTDEIDALVILPLYPQFSISTSGSSLRLLQEEFAKQQPSKGRRGELYKNMVHTVIPSWYNRPGYINAVSSLLCKEIDSFTEQQIQYAIDATPNEKPIHVLFSAHGVPKSYIDAGDPYQKQIIDCVDAISKVLPYANVEVHLSYQSRVGPIEWLRPYTDDVLPALGERGIKNLVVVPISFVSEHIETLEEIDIEYRELAEESGIVNWKRCPALNTDPIFITDMADMVMEALSEPAQTVTEACVANMVSDLVDAESDSINIAGVQGVGGGDAKTDMLVSARIVGPGSRVILPSTVPNQRGQQSLVKQERFYARFAMISVTVALLLELIYGQSLINLFTATSNL